MEALITIALILGVAGCCLLPFVAMGGMSLLGTLKKRRKVSKEKQTPGMPASTANRSE